jgi:hypothetical protein
VRADPGEFGLSSAAAAALCGFLEAGWIEAGVDEHGLLHFKTTPEGRAALPGIPS